MQNEDSSGQPFDPQPLFASVDTWERECIARIQTTAHNARCDLQRIIDHTEEEFLSNYASKMVQLRASFQTDNQLNEWMEQLRQLQAAILSSSSVRLTRHKRPRMSMINTIIEEKFARVIGDAVLHDEGRLAKHTTDDWNYEYLLGERLYYEGRHTIVFQLDQNGTPYNIFFGCISSQAIESRISIGSSFTVGWFGNNQVYQHGLRRDDAREYNSNDFAMGDILHLTMDCDRQQIELFHEESKKTHRLQVNIIKAPFPWQLLVVLTDKDDCVRIISGEKSHD